MDEELFVIEGAQCWNWYIIMNKFTKVMLRSPDPEITDLDLLWSIILHSIVKNQYLFFELEACIFRLHHEFAERLFIE